ncbi:imelysin family protein [Marivirga sp. S37H4]|uniref:Imelysin family protein n=1 Tax=Marivirga aurantiaca TaxID=2802615 RepID=A0A934WZ64_9BACT|nr:imelysin family protein [Marivirga aurantiaca]MBK6265889.1 imelysin family protein [Marivirga aurantiaca]
MRSVKFFFFCLVIATLTACDNESGSEKVDFDREAFLVNMADQVVRPSIENFATKAEVLTSASVAFNEDVSESNLSGFRDALKATWLSYQHLAFVQVGPVATVNLRDRVNIFPTSVEKIEENITSGNYTLGAASNVAAKGFPALDYLLFGTGISEADVVAYFADQELGPNRKEYLQALVADIQSVATSMAGSWGDYRSGFVENLGTDAGSGTSLLVNEFNFQFDIRIKNAKIGFPSGGNPRTGGILSPEKVEAYYSAWSGELAEAAVKASLAVFKGENFTSGENGLGMDDYLTALDAKTRDDEDLSTVIINQINASLDEMEKIDEPYSVVASQEGSQLVTVYNALQAVIPLIKVDMPSAMSVSITFQDNDGD